MAARADRPGRTTLGTPQPDDDPSPGPILRLRRGQEKKLNPIEYIRGYQDQLTAWRRDFHAHPEIGFEEHRTSDIVAEAA